MVLVKWTDRTCSNIIGNSGNSYPNNSTNTEYSQAYAHINFGFLLVFTAFSSVLKLLLRHAHLITSASHTAASKFLYF